jgi:DNA repair protein RadC
MKRQAIFNLPLMERPREKLHAKGAQALSDLELLAAILGSGTKQLNVMGLASRLLRVLDQCGNAPCLEDLCAIQGVGTAKGALVIAALEFARRRIQPHGLKISMPTDVFPLIRHFADRRQEHFLCVSLNGANEVIAIRTVSVGLVNRALVHPREVYADPITDRASAIVVAHNHPSGQLTPSQDDLSVTRQLCQAGQTLGIRLLDHLIFNHERYYSFMEQGQI